MVVGRFGVGWPSARRRVSQALPLDGPGVDVNDSDAAVGPQRVDQAPAEVARHVAALEGRDGERRVEAVPAVRPVVEGRGQENEEAAAVHGAYRTADGVWPAGFLAVDDDRLAGGPEQFGRTVEGEMPGGVECRGSERSVGRTEIRGVGDAGGCEGVGCALAGPVGRAGEHEQPALAGAAGLRS